MKAKTKKVLKGAGVAVAGLCLVGAGIAGGFALDDPKPIHVDRPLIEERIVEKVVEVEKVVIEEKEILQDTPETLDALKEAQELADARLEALDSEMEEKSLILDSLSEHDGDMEWVLEDLDDDELQEVVDRIVFVHEIKSLAVDEVKKELFDELDNIVVELEEDELKLDEDEMTRLRINDDYDELALDGVDFDDKDAVVIVTGTFEQDKVKLDFEVEVEFRDGEVDDFEVVSVSERA